MWQLKDRQSLVELQTLLVKASSLNNGSGVIEKMREIQEIANKLMYSDLRRKEPSFLQFLEKEATK